MYIITGAIRQRYYSSDTTGGIQLYIIYAIWNDVTINMKPNFLIDF